MTARPQDLTLLPLPWCLLNLRADDRFAVQDYARANVTAALASAQAREEELRALLGGVECQRDANWQAYTEAEARAERLEEALRELADANFEEFCGEGTEEMEPDDSKVSYPEDRCHITFGMIRRARALLSTNAAQPGETT